ncbi:hypothetical protein [Runella sp.]|jgi:hypothetical protein|uniref:hypothetical protein n=1 Tax=Runella sp. TaxID=1960881 RepID=UPI00301686C9
MAQIRLQILDDNGTELATKSYNLGDSLDDLSRIEQQIETLRPEILIDITSELLSAEQSKHEKKHF